MTMAINTEELFAKALVAIEENKLFFIEDIADWLGISKTTIYYKFKQGSEEMNAIKDALASNRMRIKVSLRAKMANSVSPVDRMALYKLIGSDEERRRLSMTELKVSGEINNQPNIDLGRLTREQRKTWYELYNLARIDNQTIDIHTQEVEGE